MVASTYKDGSLKPNMVVAKEARLDGKMSIVDALQKLFPDVFTTPTSAKKGCRRKEVLVDGAPASTTLVVHAGGLVQLIARAGAPEAGPLQTGSYHQADERPGLLIAYEDDHFAVVVKPPGLPTQGKGQDSLQKRIKYCLKPSRAVGASNRPYNVHRLDAPTSGLVVCAKTRSAGAKLASCFAARTVSKRYIAIVKGLVQGGDQGTAAAESSRATKVQKMSAAGEQVEDGAGSSTAGYAGAVSNAPDTSATPGQQEQGAFLQGLIDHSVRGKQALTRWRVIKVTPSKAHGHLTTLSLHPLTGRKHQLRKHCVGVLGCAILGDARYQGVRAKRGRDFYLSSANAEGVGNHTSVVPSASGRVAAGAPVLEQAAAAGGGEGGMKMVTETGAAAAQGEVGGNTQAQGRGDGCSSGVGGAETNSAPASNGVRGHELGAEQACFPDGEQEGEGKQRESGTLGLDHKGGDSLGMVDDVDVGKTGEEVDDDEDGDDEEGSTVLADGVHLCLCAAELHFKHPITGEEVHIVLPEPEYFEAARQAAM